VLLFLLLLLLVSAAAVVGVPLFNASPGCDSDTALNQLGFSFSSCSPHRKIFHGASMVVGAARRRVDPIGQDSGTEL